MRGDFLKIIGIVGRSYYNKDKQPIIQTNEAIRKVLSRYKDVIAITILPTENISYVNIKMGKDKINTHKLDVVLEKCSAFIIPGGTYWYNFDNYIINYAIKKDKPLLAICAGFQALCSIDVTNIKKFDVSKKYKNDDHYKNNRKYAHYVNIQPNTKLRKILSQRRIYVNSIHHNYIDINSKFNNLKISAISKDNIIEAVEYPNKRFIIGVEWHPEYLNDSNSKKIFNSFINSIKEPN